MGQGDKREVETLRISSLIEESQIGRERGLKDLPTDEKVESYQTCGNELRRLYGDDYLSRRAIKFAIERLGDAGRCAFIFDSFKHPREIETLKRCFEERLITFTVFCPSRIRKERLERKGNSKEVIDKIFSRDEFELDVHGQKVRDTAYLSDFFVRNSQDNKSALKDTIDRYLERFPLIPVHTRTS